MKNLKLATLAFLSLIIVFGLVCLPKRICFDGAERYAFYLGKSSSDFEEVTPNIDAGLFRLTLGRIYGESAEYTSLDIEAFLANLGGEVVFVEEIGESTNYYCTADLPYYTNIYGEQINLHICVRESSVKVGTPIIYGGY